jgi:tRNA A-37 threonylcarbamoyl transferase component Bud32
VGLVLWPTMTEPARLLHLVAPAEDADPLIGQLVDGRYRIEALLGKGGMGLVYRARHQVLGKQLALKVLKPEVSRDADVMARFQREAQSASAIGSPHICDVSDFGALADGSTYFVMEFLDGPSLTAAMKEGPIQPARVIDIARQLCEALGAAHARGIVHRDLKPDNVHLVKRGSESDFVKVLDFGIAKVAGGADKKLTQAGQIFGTPHYMSPEQCSGRDVDQRTDVYALGVMLYEMACGHVPFDADTLMGVLTKHVYELPIPPHELTPKVAISAGLEAVILKCLAKRPEDRYATMIALREDLDQLGRGATPAAVNEQVLRTLGESRTAVLPSSPVSIPDMPAPVRAPKKSGAWKIGAIAALIAVAGGAFAIAFVWPSPAPEPRREVEVVEPVVEPVVERVVVERVAPPVIEAPATITMSTNPAGAIVLDATGAMIGNTPLELPRPEEGETATYTFRLHGYQEHTVTLSHRTQPALTLHLARRGGRPPRIDETRVDPVIEPVVRPVVPDPIDTPQHDDLIDPFRNQPRSR